MWKRFATLILIMAVLLGGCAKPSPNSARMVELDQAGQIMPGVPAIEGGCYVDAGDNISISKLTYIDGDCVVELTSKEWAE